MSEKTANWTAVLFTVLVLAGGSYGCWSSIKNDRIKYDKLEEEFNKTNIIFGEYVRLTRVRCKPAEEYYTQEDLSGLEGFERWTTICAETFKDFYLRRSLIRYKQKMYRGAIQTYVPHESLAELLEINIPYCLIGTDVSEFAVLEDCDRIK